MLWRESSILRVLSSTYRVHSNQSPMGVGFEIVMLDCRRKIHLRHDTAQSSACRVYAVIIIGLLLRRVIMGKTGV